MQKRDSVFNSGIITFIVDALEQHFEKGNIDFGQSLRSGILGGVGGTISSEVILENNRNQSTFSRLFTTPEIISAIERFIKQNQNLSPQEKKDFLDLSRGYKIELLNSKSQKISTQP